MMYDFIMNIIFNLFSIESRLPKCHICYIKTRKLLSLIFILKTSSFLN